MTNACMYMSHYDTVGIPMLVTLRRHGTIVNTRGGSRDFKGGVHNQRYTLHTNKVKLVVIVRSTISMRSMLILGGSGGMPPQENF